MPEIRASTVLPARRTDIELQTADGLTLVGELAVPEDRPPVATLICLHPLPTAEGMMDSHVLRKASYRLPALAGLAVLRFNTRGTTSDRGTSEGEFGEGEAERYDVAAALEWAEYHDLPRSWLLGWSFGTELALRWGRDPLVEGAILLSPPLRPERDDYLRPPEARERFKRVPQAEVIDVEGAKHLWVGEPYVRIVLNEIVRHVAPEAYPLPIEVD
jgi:uncharacterized protein